MALASHDMEPNSFIIIVDHAWTFRGLAEAIQGLALAPGLLPRVHSVLSMGGAVASNPTATPALSATLLRSLMPLLRMYFTAETPEAFEMQNATP